MRMDVIQIRDRVNLSRRRRFEVYGVGLGIWASGGAWLCLHYFFQQSGPFGPTPHPLEHWSLVLHGLFAFVSVWLAGLLWGVHIVGGWQTGRNRLSGSIMLLVLMWLIASGFLLYYLADDATISTVALLHWAVGLLLPIPFVVHRFSGRVRMPNGRPSEPGQTKTPPILEAG
ncbi:MAG: hypothetical protein JO056_02775 [Alphaproteobacteria bacterium]|jgi:hypothetical protein|nr:hypothetical protein [Alphaproteobacteria bacterium]